MQSSVVEELLSFDRLNINDFFRSKPLVTNHSMEFYVLNSNNIFYIGMVTHINVYQIGFRYKRYRYLIAKLCGHLLGKG